MLAVALAAITGAIDPPTLDDLLEDAEVEDRRRIERAIYSADATIEEVLELEEQLARKLELVAPTFASNAIAFGVRIAILNGRGDRGQRGELSILATLSIDFESIASIDRTRPIPLPGTEVIRQRKCFELGAELANVEVSARSAREHLERARALGCAWSVQ